MIANFKNIFSCFVVFVTELSRAIFLARKQKKEAKLERGEGVKKYKLRLERPVWIFVRLEAGCHETKSTLTPGTKVKVIFIIYHGLL